LPTPNPFISRDEPAKKRDSKLGSPIMGGANRLRSEIQRQTRLYQSLLSKWINDLPSEIQRQTRLYQVPLT
jgi:hypothetical protein